MISYDDIMIRDSFKEIQTGRSDVASCSVDIIPYGQEILTWEDAKDKYDKILYNPEDSVITGRTCNCYIRGRNLSPDKTVSGTARMFLMPFNVFTNPQEWYRLAAHDSHADKPVFAIPMISKQSGAVSGQIGPEEVCINESAFLLNDSYNLKAHEHYCLCAVVNTPEHPIEIPDSFRSNLDVDKWVKDNRNVALLNVIPVEMSLKQTSYSFDLGNFDKVEENFALVLRFSCDYEAGERWSDKLPVRIQCTDSRCPFDRKNLKIQSYQEGADFQTITVRIDHVPADFYGSCSVFIDNVVPLPAHGYIEMAYYQVLEDIPKEYECEKHRFLSVLGSGGYVLPLGSCNVYNSAMTVRSYYRLSGKRTDAGSGGSIQL